MVGGCRLLSGRATGAAATAGARRGRAPLAGVRAAAAGVDSAAVHPAHAHAVDAGRAGHAVLYLIHIPEPTRQAEIAFAVFPL